MSVGDVVTSSRSIGMECEAVRVGMTHIYEMPLPAVLYWQQRHFVVLYKVDKKRRRFKIADPALGRMSCKEEDLTKYWIPEGETTGVAVLMEPEEAFYEKDYERDRPLRRFFSYIAHFIRNNKKNFIFALIITLVIMGADFALPVLLQKTVDYGIGERDLGLVITLLLGQLAIGMGSFMASGAMDMILTKTGLKVHIDMIGHFLTNLAKFPLSFFDRKVSSDFIQKIDDQSRIKDFLMGFPNQMVSMLLITIVFSALLFYYSRIIFFVFVGISLMEILWSTIFLAHRKSLDYAYFTHTSENRNHSYELNGGMADLKINNAEESRINKWRTTQEALNKVSMKSAWLNLTQTGGHTLLSRVKDLSVTGIGAMMVINGDMTIGVLMTLGYITGRLAQPFSTISSMMSTLQNAVLSYQRVEEVVTSESSKAAEKSLTVQQ